MGICQVQTRHPMLQVSEQNYWERIIDSHWNCQVVLHPSLKMRSLIRLTISTFQSKACFLLQLYILQSRIPYPWQFQRPFHFLQQSMKNKAIPEFFFDSHIHSQIIFWFLWYISIFMYISVYIIHMHILSFRIFDPPKKHKTRFWIKCGLSYALINRHPHWTSLGSKR